MERPQLTIYSSNPNFVRENQMRNKTASFPEWTATLQKCEHKKSFCFAFFSSCCTMVTTCIVLGCTERARKESDISFHRFPHNDQERLRKWIQAIGRKDWLPNEHSCICNKHFTESCFVVRPGKCGRRLYDHAVPSQFLSFPKRSKKSKRKSLKK